MSVPDDREINTPITIDCLLSPVALPGNLTDESLEKMLRPPSPSDPSHSTSTEGPHLRGDVTPGE